MLRLRKIMGKYTDKNRRTVQWTTPLSVGTNIYMQTENLVIGFVSVASAYGVSTLRKILYSEFQL